MATPAERQRRSRKHKRGEHDECLPTYCSYAAGHVELPPLSVVEPAERGPRAAQLWTDLQEGLPAAHRLLLDEACRIVDRLDRLDDMLRNRDSWASYETDDGGRVTLVIDAALAEGRQHATALRGLLTEISKVLPKAKEPPAAAPKKSGVGLANLVALADRGRSTAG